MLEIISQFDFGLGAVSIAVTVLVMVNVAFLLFLGSKDHKTRAFAFATIVLALWALGMLLSVATPQQFQRLGDFLIRGSYATGMWVGLSFFYFCHAYSISSKPSPAMRWTLFVTGLIFIPLVFLESVFPSSLWREYIGGLGVNVWGTVEGPLAGMYYAIYGGLIVTGLYKVHRRIMTAQHVEEVRRTHLMFLTIAIGFIPVLIVSMILPSLGVYHYDWMGPSLNIFWVMILAYSIMKHKQMNVKVLKAELLIFALIFLLFVAIFI